MTKKVPESDFAQDNNNEETLLQIGKLAELGLSLTAVVHDLRQPVAALKIIMQMLRDREDDESQLKMEIAQGLGQIARIEALLDRTRDFTVPSEQTNRIDITAAVREFIIVEKWQFGKKIKIDLQIQPDLPTLLIDRVHFGQIFFNIINNAYDAVRGLEEGKISVAVNKYQEKGLEVIVADNGCGIKDEIAENIFKPFYSTKKAGKGTGLGLFIVQRLLEKYDGCLVVLGKSELKNMGFDGFNTGFRMKFKGTAFVEGVF